MGNSLLSEASKSSDCLAAEPEEEKMSVRFNDTEEEVCDENKYHRSFFFSRQGGKIAKGTTGHGNQGGEKKSNKKTREEEEE